MCIRDSIFRGALDVRATQINEAMKLAAVKALADLTRTPVPDIVNMAYNEKNMLFGPTYIIPKPLDPRLLATIAPAVARAAMESGVAQANIENWEAYGIELNKRLGQMCIRDSLSACCRHTDRGLHRFSYRRACFPARRVGAPPGWGGRKVLSHWLRRPDVRGYGHRWGTSRRG